MATRKKSTFLPAGAEQFLRAKSLETCGLVLIAVAVAGRLPWITGPRAALAIALGSLVFTFLAGVTLGHWNPPLVRVAELVGSAAVAVLVARLACAVLPRIALLGSSLVWLVAALAAAGIAFTIGSPEQEPETGPESV